MNQSTKRWMVGALQPGQGESVLETVRGARPMPAAPSSGPGKSGMERPKILFVRFNGFTDRDTVAQAATNAGAVR